MPAPPNHTPQPRDCRPDESLTDHLRCLPRGLIPMADDDTSRLVEKVIALILVAAWAAVFVGLSFEGVGVVEPRFWGIFTAIVFILVGKLWDLEVRKYLPGTASDSREPRPRSEDDGDD